MSIRPVDLQMMVQKAPDLAKPALQENQHPEIQQQAVAEKFTKESLLNEERVLLTEHTQNGEVNEDGKGSAEYRRGKERRERKNRDAKEEPPKNGLFDMSV